MAKTFILIWLFAVSIAYGYEGKMTTDQLVSQSDVVVTGKLSGVKEWVADGVEHGEGVIAISDTIHGEVPESKKVTLRWSNRLYRSGALRFSDTGEEKFIWLLWRAQDGSFRAQHSGCRAPLSDRPAILAAIQKRKAEQTGAGQPASAHGSKRENKDKP